MLKVKGKTILYAVVSDDLINVINWVKLPTDVKRAFQKKTSQVSQKKIKSRQIVKWLMSWAE